MESICRLCFQPAALFQVPGYNLPTCVKCSEHLTANTQSLYTTTTGTGTNTLVVTTIPAAATVLPSQINVQHTQTASQVTGGSAITTTVGGTTNQIAIPVENHQSGSKKNPTMNHLNYDMIKTDHLDVDVIFNEEGTCPLCSKTFSKKSSLLTHIRNHSAERRFMCTYCNKGFTQAANLRNHERIHTNDRPYVCGDCGKTFTQITNLNNHRRLHTGERPFVCIEPECGRSFAQVTNLNNHMKTHHKVQQYCCNLCTKKFTQVTSLNAHLQAHAGITGYYCPRCPEKTFKQQSQLHTHMKSHGLAFPYECPKCDEKFHQPQHLDQHLKMHDEFKFKCDMCPSSFNQEELLKKHIQRHIDGRYLQCPVANCNQAFAVKQHLTKHLLTRHSHSELPPSKRSKKQSSSSAATLMHQPVQIISQQHHLPLTTTPGRGRPPKKSNSKDMLNNHLQLPTMVKIENQDYTPTIQIHISHLPNTATSVSTSSSSPSTVDSSSTTQNGGSGSSSGNSSSSSSSGVSGNNQNIKIEITNDQVHEHIQQIQLGSHHHQPQHIVIQQLDPDDLKCNDCGVILPTEQELRDHIFYKHPERRFMQAVLEENKMRQRTQSQQSFVCDLCCNVFKTNLALVRHTVKFHG